MAVRPASRPPAPGARIDPGHPVFEETRVGAARSTLSVPLRPSSRTLPAWIESRFRGQIVYTMIIPAPRLPMYQGDWILWFAEGEPQPGSAPQMRAPLPFRKLEA